ncbi:type II toxin-antitoxin system ParD family antitoxin [Caballeronia sp. RCC_10]|jgi:antitoxin ParD1/3/4|uniref:type II toxin-antitoxin system ParD family antitoxin n=1 Tax=Caballeronia sp. RCC_10 TaxID=3239227 RepID=UPI0035265BD9
MPSKHALSISVTERLAAFIKQEVDGGRYGSASEVVRAGLRLLEEQTHIARSPGSLTDRTLDTSEPPAKKRAPTQGKA